VKVDEGRFGHGRSIVLGGRDDADSGCDTPVMTRRRLVPLGLLVAALLGVVAVATHQHPLGTGGPARGASQRFVDYVYTSFYVLLIACTLLTIWLFVANQSGVPGQTRPRRHPLATLAFIVMCGLIGWGLASSGFERRLRALEQRLHLAQRRQNQIQPGGPRGKRNATPRPAQLRWDEVAIALALLAALGVVALGVRRRRGDSPSLQRASQAAVSAALDESLDDLRSEPDLRKAIIAAYARMERALGLVGMPRRPAEAPLEYVERALGELETSAGAIRRLTDLFEWAKFSHHEPEPSMRDEAIDALVAVRDELRAPAGELVAG
jgi:hypothetical protein